MRATVKMPKLGDTANTVLVIEWQVQPGERVTQGQPLMSVETDKVDSEVPAPIAGTLAAQLVQADDEVAAGDAIAVMDV